MQFLRGSSGARPWCSSCPSSPRRRTPKGEKTGPAKLYEFSPDAQGLLDDLLPAASRPTLFQCFMDAVVSEHVARMVAMKAATDNAGKMGKRLTRIYNRARQAQITTELTEIISGAAALKFGNSSADSGSRKLARHDLQIFSCRIGPDFRHFMRWRTDSE
jgi:hypothetical protein